MRLLFFGNHHHKNRKPAGTGKLLGVFLAAAVFCTAGCEKSRVIYLEQEKNGLAEDMPADTGRDTKPDPESEVQAVSETDSEKESTGGAVSGTVTVFVCGAVKTPGVYELPDPSRAKAAVDAAGGFREDADTEWCNLAQMLYDGQKLRIYSLQETKNLESEGFAEDDADYSANTAGRLKGETGGTNGSTGQTVQGIGSAGLSGTTYGPASAAGEGRINLNTATKEQLMTLPGIGDARAEAILSWRRQHGAFTQIEQIKEISGLKNAVFGQIKDLIYVD